MFSNCLTNATKAKEIIPIREIKWFSDQLGQYDNTLRESKKRRPRIEFCHRVVRRLIAEVFLQSNKMKLFRPFQAYGTFANLSGNFAESAPFPPKMKTAGMACPHKGNIKSRFRAKESTTERLVPWWILLFAIYLAVLIVQVRPVFCVDDFFCCHSHRHSR